MARTLRLLVLCGLLLGATVNAQDDDGYDPDDMGGGDDDYSGEGGGGDDDYGGGGEDEEPPPPPPSDIKELTSLEDFDMFLDDNDASVIAAITALEVADPDASLPEGWDPEEDGEWETPKIENPTLASVKEMSSGLSDYRWAYSSAPEVLEKLKSKNGGLYLYRSPRFVSKDHGDRPRERFPSTNLQTPTVSTWLSDKAQPLVGQYTYSTKPRYLGEHTAPKLPTLIVFLNLDFDANAKSVKYVLKRARKVAVALKGKVSVSVAALSDFKYDLDSYGLESKSEVSDLLMGLIQRKGGKDHYYGAKTAFSEKALQAFADSFLAGELTPSKVDDGSPPPPPPDEEEGGDVDETDVVVLDSSNFEEIVGDTTKDKLIEFYAPWCGHCKALTPEYAKAATELADDYPNVVLAKMDATANDPPAEYKVEGYPTLYFVKAGEGEKPVPYEGEREAGAIVSFIKENAVTSA